MTMTLAATMLALLSSPAMANSHEEPGDCAAMEGDEKTKCEEAKAAAEKAMADAKKALEELGDCSDKEGDDKTACETKKAELEKKAGETKEPDAGKGGKAARGNTNRMEEENPDE